MCIYIYACILSYHYAHTPGAQPAEQPFRKPFGAEAFGGRVGNSWLGLIVLETLFRVHMGACVRLGGSAESCIGIRILAPCLESWTSVLLFTDFCVFDDLCRLGRLEGVR